MTEIKILHGILPSGELSDGVAGWPDFPFFARLGVGFLGKKFFKTRKVKFIIVTKLIS